MYPEKKPECREVQKCLSLSQISIMYPSIIFEAGCAAIVAMEILAFCGLTIGKNGKRGLLTCTE